MLLAFVLACLFLVQARNDVTWVPGALLLPVCLKSDYFEPVSRFQSFEEWKLRNLKDTNEGATIPQHLETNKVNQTREEWYKERFNYASSDCASTVLKSNPECKGSSAILVENKDSYMLNPCSANNKFFTVELCQDILIDTIHPCNFEYFSSMFRDVRVAVSDRYPAAEWHTLGDFRAENTRGVQSFTIRDPLLWARYARIELLTHYGNEFYCPLSLLRVYGTTMMDQVKQQEKRPTTTIARPLVTVTAWEFCPVETGLAMPTCPTVSLPSPTTALAAPVQTTLESIYEVIMKRISLLEANASLSLAYIEDQSRHLSGTEKKRFDRIDEVLHALSPSLTNINLSAHGERTRLDALDLNIAKLTRQVRLQWMGVAVLVCLVFRPWRF